MMPKIAQLDLKDSKEAFADSRAIGHAIGENANEASLPPSFAHFEKVNLGWQVTVITALAIVAFMGSFNCFFFADDFLCLDYLHQIFNGRPELVLERLSSPWQDTSISLLYRPLVDLLLMADYAVWKTNSFGYHLSNFLLHLASSFACLFLVKALVKDFGDTARLIPFCAAALFAVYPAHVEPVLWICCRADLAATFLVLSFLCLSINGLSAQKPSRLVWAGLAYLGALMCKESAACALLILGAYLWCFKPKGNGSFSIRFGLGLCALSASYFVLRYFVLGVFLGGYTGSMAHVFSASWATRVLDPDLLAILAMAANAYLFNKTDAIVQGLHFIWIAFGVLFLLRAPIAPWSSGNIRLLVFLASASLIALAPAFQVLGITQSLTNSRVFYMASAFYLPLLVCGTMLIEFDSSAESSSKRDFERTSKTKLTQRVALLKTSAAGLFVLLLLMYCYICNQSISPWVEGGKLLRAVQSELSSVLGMSDKPVMLLNFPSNFKGVHLLYEHRELSTLLGPPFFGDDRFSKKIYSLDEYPDFVGARFQDLRNQGIDRLCQLLWFSERDSRLRPFALSAPATQSQEIPLSGCIRRGDGLFVPLGTIRPDLADAFDLEIDFKGRFVRPILGLAFTKSEEAPPERQIFFVLVEYGKRGLQHFVFPSNILRKAVDLSQPRFLYVRLSPDATLKSIRLRSPSESPTIKVNFSGTNADEAAHGIRNHQESPAIKRAPGIQGRPNSLEALIPNGKFRLAKKGRATLEFDGSQVPGAKGLYVEVSKPNHFLHFGGIGANDPFKSKFVARAHQINSTTGRISIGASDLGDKRAFYQVRVCATDAQGNLVGAFSDPIEFDSRANNSNHPF